MKVGELGDYEGKIWKRNGKILHNTDPVDIHCLTAVRTSSITYDQVTKAIRQAQKPVGFGIIYGLTAMGLAEDLGISIAKAQKLIDGWLYAYQDVDAFLRQCRDFIVAHKYMDTFYGRRRWLPHYAMDFGRRDLERSGIVRQLVNHIIQGTGSDVTRMAMVRVHNAIKKAKMPAKVVLQVHDELVLRTKRSIMHEAAHLLEDEMETMVKKVRLTATARAVTTLSKSAMNLLEE